MKRISQTPVGFGYHSTENYCMRKLILIILFVVSQTTFAENILSKFYLANFSKPTYTENNKTLPIFPPHKSEVNHNVFIFAPSQHMWALYNIEGDLVGTGKASGGKDFCSDINQECRTVEGSFTIF